MGVGANLHIQHVRFSLSSPFWSPSPYLIHEYCLFSSGGLQKEQQLVTSSLGYLGDDCSWV